MTVSPVCISEYFDWCSEQEVKSGNKGLSYVSTFALIGAILSVVTYS